MLVIVEWSMRRRQRPRRTTGFTLQTFAHGLTRSAHVTAGLHLTSQQVLVTMSLKCKQFEGVGLKGLVQVTENPGDGMSYIMSLHDSE